MSTTMPVRELLYEAGMQITGETDFGLGMQPLLSGQASMPPQGVRLDYAFAGEVTGAKLNGKIEGIDYVLVRADGVAEIHAHAVITTADGARIALFAAGVSAIPQGSAVAQLRETVRLHTASPAYAWVNGLALWATGESDLATGKSWLKAYVA